MAPLCYWRYGVIPSRPKVRCDVVKHRTKNCEVACQNKSITVTFEHWAVAANHPSHRGSGEWDGAWEVNIFPSSEIYNSIVRIPAPPAPWSVRKTIAPTAANVAPTRDSGVLLLCCDGLSVFFYPSPTPTDHSSTGSAIPCGGSIPVGVMNGGGGGVIVYGSLALANKIVGTLGWFGRRGGRWQAGLKNGV